MAWTVNYTESARKTLRKLDTQQARRILDFIELRIGTLEDPRSQGTVLSGPLGDLWRFWSGDDRIICHIRDAVVCVLVLNIGNSQAGSG